MILFLDENMPPKVAAALQALGTCEARHLVDHLPRGTSDEEIFDFLSEQGWFLVTHDSRIRRRPHQRAALLNSGIGAFIFSGRASRSVDEMMIMILSRLPKIRDYVANNDPPFNVSISDKGVFDTLTP